VGHCDDAAARAFDAAAAQAGQEPFQAGLPAKINPILAGVDGVILKCYTITVKLPASSSADPLHAASRNKD